MSRQVEVILTPTPSQYERLVEDLETLREGGAPTNTAAILDAVRQAAYAGRVQKAPRQRVNAPGPDTRRYPDANIGF